MSFLERFRALFASPPQPAPEPDAVMYFIPRRNFFSPEFQSHYLDGMRYTVRPGNRQLEHIVRTKWLPGELVRIVTGPGAQLRGS